MRDNVIIKEITSKHIKLEQKLALPTSFKETLDRKIEKLFAQKLNVIMDKAFETKEISIAEQEEAINIQNINNFKDSLEFKAITKTFPNAEIISTKSES